MKRFYPLTLAAGVLAAAMAGTVLGQPSAATPSDLGPRAVGLTDNGTLVSFRVERPGNAVKVGPVTGLDGDTLLVGIDYRPANGQLYGVGDAGGIYMIAPGTANATKVSQLTVALSGMAFGVDFNPAADRLRIVSDTGQNLRHDVNPGGVTATDLALSTPPTVGTTTGVTGAAYTNNDNDPDTGTLLFDLNTATDQIAAQAPANNGTLSITGSLGKAAAGDSGFDVFSRTVDGQTVSNAAWAVLQVGAARQLHSIDLLTGDATFRGRFPTKFAVVDLAIQPAG